MTFVAQPSVINDRIVFQTEPASLPEQEHLLLDEKNGIDISESKVRNYRLPSPVALRIRATPASSAASEQNFSLFKFIIVPGRNRRDEETLEALEYLRSVLNDYV